MSQFCLKKCFIVNFYKYMQVKFIEKFCRIYIKCKGLKKMTTKQLKR